MIWINFEKWSSSGGKFFVCNRIYTKRNRWTPFVKVVRKPSHVIPTYERETSTVVNIDGKFYRMMTDEECAKHIWGEAAQPHVEPDLLESCASKHPNVYDLNCKKCQERYNANRSTS